MIFKNVKHKTPIRISSENIVKLLKLKAVLLGVGLNIAEEAQKYEDKHNGY